MTSDSLDRFAERKLKSLTRGNLRRELRETDRLSGVAVRHDGREFVSFTCNDYLGLSHHPDVIAASLDATRRFGAGAGASRLITGNHSLYAGLEAQLAAIKGTEDAMVFGSGYLTNVGVIAALVGAADLIVIDELCHSCLLTGAALSRAKVVPFSHNDSADAELKLERYRGDARHCLLITDGVFSMEGTLAPLDTLAQIAKRHDAWLMTDDAHGLGVVGDGRGSSFAFDAPVDVPLQMGTLSKAVGAYGGYLCASRVVIELLRNRARSFVYSTGLPPGTVAAASAALSIIATDRERVATPLRHARRFCQALGLAAADSAIVPLLLGSPQCALDASRALKDAGLLVAAIRPPTVPRGGSRLRFAFSAEHTGADIDRAIEATAKIAA